MTTWREIAVRRPEIVQLYVQEMGPLPDEEVTEESWNLFWEWIISKSEL